MILQCPECSARFAVPDALMPPEGRTVKCGRCAHQWHAEGVMPTPETAPTSFVELAQAAHEEAPAATPPRLPVPAKTPTKPWVYMAGAGALATCWLMIAFIAHYPSWMKIPGLDSIYATFGVTSTEGLVFEDVMMQRNEMDELTQFLIVGSIANHAAEKRIVPTVRVQLKNKDGESIWSREYPVNEPLEPGKPYAFRIDNIETNFADNVASIALDIGHPLQLMMR